MSYFIKTQGTLWPLETVMHCTDLTLLRLLQDAELKPTLYSVFYMHSFANNQRLNKTKQITRVILQHC